MNDFVRRGSQLQDLPQMLCDRIPGFASSPEVELVAEAFDLPTVAADALGEYVLRVAASGERSRELDAAPATVEWWRRAMTERPRTVRLSAC